LGLTSWNQKKKGPTKSRRGETKGNRSPALKDQKPSTNTGRLSIRDLSNRINKKRVKKRVHFQGEAPNVKWRGTTSRVDRDTRQVSKEKLGVGCKKRRRVRGLPGVEKKRGTYATPSKTQCGKRGMWDQQYVRKRSGRELTPRESTLVWENLVEKSGQKRKKTIQQQFNQRGWAHDRSVGRGGRIGTGQRIRVNGQEKADGGGPTGQELLRRKEPKQNGRDPLKGKGESQNFVMGKMSGPKVPHQARQIRKKSTE